jgi:hypothetical protein
MSGAGFNLVTQICNDDQSTMANKFLAPQNSHPQRVHDRVSGGRPTTRQARQRKVIVDAFDVGHNPIQIQRPFPSGTNIIHHDKDIDIRQQKPSKIRFQAYQRFLVIDHGPAAAIDQLGPCTSERHKLRVIFHLSINLGTKWQIEPVD